MEDLVNYVENASALKPSNLRLSLGWAVQNSWNSGLRRDHSFVCEQSEQGMLAKGCHVLVRAWLCEPSCCLSIRVEGVVWVVHGFLLQGLRQGDSVRRGCLDNKQTCRHPARYWGTGERWYHWEVQMLGSSVLFFLISSHNFLWFLKSNFSRLNLFPLKASPLASFFLSNESLLLPFFFQFSFIYSRSREFDVLPSKIKKCSLPGQVVQVLVCGFSLYTRGG